MAHEAAPHTYFHTYFIMDIYLRTTDRLPLADFDKYYEDRKQKTRNNVAGFF